jgi:hypothetical protein
MRKERHLRRIVTNATSRVATSRRREARTHEISKDSNLWQFLIIVTESLAGGASVTQAAARMLSSILNTPSTVSEE